MPRNDKIVAQIKIDLAKFSRRKEMKKLSRLVLAGLMAVSLTACGSQEQTKPAETRVLNTWESTEYQFSA